MLDPDNIIPRRQSEQSRVQTLHIVMECMRCKPSRAFFAVVAFGGQLLDESKRFGFSEVETIQIFFLRLNLCLSMSKYLVVSGWK